MCYNKEKQEVRMDLEIVYEDNHILVVVKPVGIPVQEDKSGDLDLLSMLKEYIKDTYEKKGNVYLGLVHRLDRMVSGVMVFAKTSKAAARLSESIRKKDVKKKYFAIVNGKIEKSNQKVRLEHFLLKNERLNKSQVVDKDCHKQAKLAILEYQVVKNFKKNGKEYTIVEIDLHTGRHHQIRVQFAKIGHPLYGDQKYGQKVNKVGEKVGLFSYSLTFPHPTKDEICQFCVMPYEAKNHDPIWEELRNGL